MVDPAVDAA
jgi:hypothetical protein